MRDTELYRQILGIESPWAVESVELDRVGGEVRVQLVYRGDRPACPECGVASSRYDGRPRRWRHLDTCQFETILIAEVPRVECREHGVRQIRVPWGEPGSRFTALFEALLIDWLREASLQSVAEQFGLSWKAVSGVMARAVQRGLARRSPVLPVALGIDETSFQRRHEYVTVVIDRAAGGAVLHVADGRGRQGVDEFLAEFSAAERAAVESVSMDMHAPYVAAVRSHIPGAEHKIAFDKFHVAQHLGRAVDQVRRAEHQRLSAAGDDRLKGTRHLWRYRLEHLDAKRRIAFAPLRASALQTARAWAIKELAMSLWRYRRRAWADKAWRRWYAWAIRSRLEPIRRVARLVQRHLPGIVNAIVLATTNARSEALNAKIQWIKYAARGFRNRQRFRDAIYFHLGGLDLYPVALNRA